VGRSVAVLYRPVWPEGGYRNSCNVQAGVAQSVGRSVAVLYVYLYNCVEAINRIAAYNTSTCIEFKISRYAAASCL